jgi:hypothetical protein
LHELQRDTSLADLYVVSQCREVKESTQDVINECAHEYETGEPRVVTQGKYSEKGNRARGGETPAQIIDHRNRRSENADLDNSIGQRVQPKEVIEWKIVKGTSWAIEIKRQIIKSASWNIKRLPKHHVCQERLERSSSPADPHVHHLIFTETPA